MNTRPSPQVADVHNDLVEALAHDLEAWPDEQLASLLSRRPDLATPPPPGIRILAHRALTPNSLSHLGEFFSLPHIAIIETALNLSNETRSLPTIVTTLRGRLPKKEVVSALKELRSLAVIWGPDPELSISPGVISCLPWRGQQTLAPAALLGHEELSTRLALLTERPRLLLDRLATGTPLGITRDAHPHADPHSPTQQLITANLLVALDEQTVELPPIVGQLLRHEPVLEMKTLSAPDWPTAGRFDAKAIDLASGAEALELLRHLSEILEALAQSPAAVLRSGGMGIREIRKLGRTTGLTDTRVGLMLELARGLELIAEGMPEPPPINDTGETTWAPTLYSDGWLSQSPNKRWLQLTQIWFTLDTRPWLIGERTDGQPNAALSPELLFPGASVERQIIFRALADSPASSVVNPNDLFRYLLWKFPRWGRRISLHAITSTLNEAQELGLIAHGAITKVGRYLAEISDEQLLTELPATALPLFQSALPETINYFFTQADHTITAPGPLEPELAEELSLLASLESGGSASVYRVDEASLRRALDSGKSAIEINNFLAAHSKTPVPQLLTYLIDDVARKHGQLRIGLASAFIRSDDEVLLMSVMNSPAAESLALRLLAPTVAISQAGLVEIVTELRKAGFAAAGEDTSGSLVDLRSRGSRIPLPKTGRGTKNSRNSRRAATLEQLLGVVSRIRSFDNADKHSASSTAASAVGGGEQAQALLQLAILSSTPVRLGYVDAAGTSTRIVVVPQRISSGQLLATETGRAASDPRPRSFSLHRVTRVELLT